VGEQAGHDDGIEAGLPDRLGHAANSGIALGLADGEGGVAPAQHRMAPLAAVLLRPAPVLGEKQRQVAPGRREILRVEGRSSGSVATRP
jgi:hypothetical protein